MNDEGSNVLQYVLMRSLGVRYEWIFVKKIVELHCRICVCFVLFVCLFVCVYLFQCSLEMR